MWGISKRRGALTAASALAIGGLAAWVAWTFAGGAGQERPPAGPPLNATGYIDPGELAPGHTIPVTAEVYNPNYFGVSVLQSALTHVDVVVSAPDQGCRPEDVLFTGRRLGMVLDPWTARRVPVGTLTMKPGAGHGCEHAGFEVDLRFATRAHAN